MSVNSEFISGFRAKSKIFPLGCGHPASSRQKGGAQTNPLKSLSLVKEAALLIVHLWAEIVPE